MVYLNNPKLYAIKIEDHKKGGLFQLTDFETLDNFGICGSTRLFENFKSNFKKYIKNQELMNLAESGEEAYNCYMSTVVERIAQNAHIWAKTKQTRRRRKWLTIHKIKNQEVLSFD